MYKNREFENLTFHFYFLNISADNGGIRCRCSWDLFGGYHFSDYFIQALVLSHESKQLW